MIPDIPDPIWPEEDNSPYPENWDQIARAIKEAAGWKCVRCGHPHDPPSGYCLTVHHLIPAEEMSEILWWNLVPLCQRCHLQIQHQVKMFRQWLFEHSPWFRPYVAGFYAWQDGEDITMHQAQDNLDYYLTLGQPWRKKGGET